MCKCDINVTMPYCGRLGCEAPMTFSGETGVTMVYAATTQRATVAANRLTEAEKAYAEAKNNYKLARAENDAAYCEFLRFIPSAQSDTPAVLEAPSSPPRKLDDPA